MGARVRAKKLGLTSGAVDYTAIYERDGGRCWICNLTVGPLKAAHFDHVIPLAKGGQHAPDNIRVACPACNRRKAGRLPTPALIAAIREEVLGQAA